MEVQDRDKEVIQSAIKELEAIREYEGISDKTREHIDRCLRSLDLAYPKFPCFKHGYVTCPTCDSPLTGRETNQCKECGQRLQLKIIYYDPIIETETLEETRYRF